MGNTEPLSKALSFNSLMIGIGAVMAGNAAAQLHGNAEFFPATICLIFVVFAQLAANCYHRYHAMMAIMGLDNDSSDKRASSLPGYEKMMFYKVFWAGAALMALMAGCTLITMGGIWFGVIGLFILITSWLMVGGKLPLLLTPWGAVFTFILFGPVAVITTTILQSSHEATEVLSWFDISPAIYMGVTIGFMAANCCLLYTYATYFKAKKVMRDTFPAMFGRRITRIVYLVNSVLACGVFTYSCFTLGLDRPWIGVVPGMVCLFVDIYVWWGMKTRPRYRLYPLTDWACLNVLLMGIISSIVSLWVGIPDDSTLQLF